MEAFANIISLISSFLYSYILIALLIAAGLYFTIKTGFIQFRLFGESIRVIAEKREDRERCLPIRKHRGAREKRYSFGYAVFLILALMK